MAKGASLAEAAAVVGAAVQAVAQGLGQISESVKGATENSEGLTRLAADDAAAAGSRDYCGWLAGGAEGADCRRALGLPSMGTGIDMGDMKMNFTPPSNQHVALSAVEQSLVCLAREGVLMHTAVIAKLRELPGPGGSWTGPPAVVDAAQGAVAALQAGLDPTRGTDCCKRLALQVRLARFLMHFWFRF